MVGTWTAGWSRFGIPDDTLIIREDGTYKQILDLPNTEGPPFKYESDWQPWRLEYGENGLPYLHMTGMRLCAYTGGYIGCDVVGGGDSPKAQWYDSCKETWVHMPGEGVLIVMGRPRLSAQTPEPHTVDLFLLQRGEDRWAYQLYETAVPTATVTSPP